MGHVKKSLCLSAALMASVFLAPAVLAQEADSYTSTILDKTPSLNNDEMKQVLFKASMPENYIPKGVNWQIHNPFRDRTFVGIVVTVEYKPASAEKQQSLTSSRWLPPSLAPASDHHRNSPTSSAGSSGVAP